MCVVGACDVCACSMMCGVPACVLWGHVMCVCMQYDVWCACMCVVGACDVCACSMMCGAPACVLWGHVMCVHAV